MFSQCDPTDTTQRPITGATSGKDSPSVERPTRLREDYVIKMGLDYFCMYLAGLRSVTEYVLSSSPAQRPMLSMYKYSVTRGFTASNPNSWKKVIDSSIRHHIFEFRLNVPHPRVHIAPRERKKGLFCF